LKRLFTEGADVKEGEVLFKIDPGPYQASLQSAQATLSRASANLENLKLQAERAGKMVKEGLGTQQDFENATAAVKTAEADKAGGAAAVQTAALNLDYTTVKAPIAGRIGRAEVTEGAYVQASTATLMATIQQIDSIYVDLTWSSAEALRLRREIESGRLKGSDGQAVVTLFLEDGSQYPEQGKMQFTDVTVEASTGSISLRALFANPKNELLPGMFVRARLEEGSKPDAILVPQRAVTRDATGKATALIVDEGNKVARRTLQAERAVGDSWLVTDGLKAGDRVIVEGLQKVRPDAIVVPVPAQEKKQAAR
jgi:membrane fusion protein, multidrug efflux system